MHYIYVNTVSDAAIFHSDCNVTKREEVNILLTATAPDHETSQQLCRKLTPHVEDPQPHFTTKPNIKKVKLNGEGCTSVTNQTSCKAPGQTPPLHPSVL